jgi:hypothetical protein
MQSPIPARSVLGIYAGEGVRPGPRVSNSRVALRCKDTDEVLFEVDPSTYHLFNL